MLNLTCNPVTISINIEAAIKGGFLVPRAGIEPARGYASADFESAASTNFTTPALLLRKSHKNTSNTDLFNYLCSVKYYAS